MHSYGVMDPPGGVYSFLMRLQLKKKRTHPLRTPYVPLAIIWVFCQLTSNMLAAAFCCLKLISSGFYQACEDRIYLAGDRHLILAVL